MLHILSHSGTCKCASASFHKRGQYKTRTGDAVRLDPANGLAWLDPSSAIGLNATSGSALMFGGDLPRNGAVLDCLYAVFLRDTYLHASNPVFLFLLQKMNSGPRLPDTRSETNCHRTSYSDILSFLCPFWKSLILIVECPPALGF